MSQNSEHLSYVQNAVEMAEKQRIGSPKLAKVLKLWVKQRLQSRDYSYLSHKMLKNIGITLFALLQIDLKYLNHSPNVLSN